MTNFFESLAPEAQEDLLRHGIIELVSVSARAVPDPERPEDRLSMKIVGEVNDIFLQNIPAIDRYLDRVDEICSASNDDLSLSLRDELLVTIEKQRDDFAELKNGMMNGKPAPHVSDPVVAELLRPCLEHPVIDALVWCIGWCAIREDDGRLFVYCDNPLISEYADDDSWARIQDRMRRVNYVIGGMMAELLGE